MELAAKDSTTGRCPACRTEYKEDEIDFTAPDPNEYVRRASPPRHPSPPTTPRAAGVHPPPPKALLCAPSTRARRRRHAAVRAHTRGGMWSPALRPQPPLTPMLTTPQHPPAYMPTTTADPATWPARLHPRVRATPPTSANALHATTKQARARAGTVHCTAHSTQQGTAP
jgi:hypothetical protein